MSISNPCTWFATGGGWKDRKSFTYEGDNILFHFSTKMVDDKMFSHWIPVNVVFFANDETHALQVLIRMFEFHIRCKAEYMAHCDETRNHRHHEEYLERAKRDCKVSSLILEHLRAGKIVPERAPTDQFYKVGWADNDEIL